VDVSKLFTEEERTDIQAFIPALERRLLQTKLSPEQEKVLREFLADRPQLGDEAILSSIRLVMSTPEYQVT